MDEHHLTQMVDKATHSKEILDLLYASNPQVPSDCFTSEIYFKSDHHLVSFTLNHVENYPEENKITDRIINHEIAKYDFRSANKEALRKTLSETNWKEYPGPPSEVTAFNKRFAEGIVNAAKRAGVPQYPPKSETRK